jgi:hypothetical protein
MSARSTPRRCDDEGREVESRAKARPIPSVCRFGGCFDRDVKENEGVSVRI